MEEGHNMNRNLLLQGTTLNLLKKAIDDWQADTTPVYVSGIPTTDWNMLNSIPKSAGAQTNPWTILARAHSIRQNCLITQIKVNIYYLGATGGVPWEFKLFTWNGSAYECKASQSFQPAGSGAVNNIQTITLTTPIAANEGDIPGLYMPLKNAAVAGTQGSNAKTTPTALMYAGNLSVGQSDVFATDFGDYQGLVNLQCLSTRPYAVFMGDSIFGGSNGVNATERWHPDQENVASYHTPGGSPGIIDNSVPYRVSTRMPATFRYQNFSKGGNTFATTISSSQLARAVLAQPKVVFIHCGVNDVAAGRTWAQISANLDTIRTAFPAGTQFYLDEVLPWASADVDAVATRALNVNYAAYCVTNGWTLVPCHDQMAIIRASTGLLDDMVIAYRLSADWSTDNVHLSITGVDALAALVAAKVKP